MTRSDNMEHVGVLLELRSWMHSVGFLSRVSALDAAIAALSDQQPLSGGGVFGWVYGDAFVEAKFWTADEPPKGWTPVYTAPPSGGEWPVAWRILWSPKSPETAELTSDGERVLKVQALDDPPYIEPLYTAPPSAAVTEAEGEVSGIVAELMESRSAS